jgi:hypothetical protein
MLLGILKYVVRRCEARLNVWDVIFSFKENRINTMLSNGVKYVLVERMATGLGISGKF